MSVQKISNAILGVGVDDTTIDLFESQYPVPTGVSYNSYVILDEKVAILDTVDNRATDAWLANLTEALGDRMPEYLVVSHMEPDHGANIARLAAKYPDMKVVGNAKTFVYMEQFFGPDAVAKERRVVVKDGESLSLGSHTLTFVFAPMVHWPEVMVSYESSEKVLFSADGFGRFGAVAKFDEKADWASEARRYYLNIVGKYGPQVQALLKKAAALDIATICPLHGPVLTGDLGKYLAYYDTWSSYKPEEPEKILVASASIHGHTRAAAHTMAEKLRAKGAKVVEMDLTRTDVSYAVTEAFRCGKIVLACATYDGFLFPPMESLLTHLKTKAFQNRTVGLMENGTWAPMAAKLMRAELESMKNITVCENVVTIRSAANAARKPRWTLWPTRSWQNKPLNRVKSEKTSCPHTGCDKITRYAGSFLSGCRTAARGRECSVILAWKPELRRKFRSDGTARHITGDLLKYILAVGNDKSVFADHLCQHRSNVTVKKQ